MKALHGFIFAFLVSACHRAQVEESCSNLHPPQKSHSPAVTESTAKVASAILLAEPWDVHLGKGAEDSLSTVVADRLRAALGDSVRAALLFLIAHGRPGAVPASGMYIRMELPREDLEQLLLASELDYRARSVAYRALAELEAPEATLVARNGRVQLGEARKYFVCEGVMRFLTSSVDSVTPSILRGILERMEREAERGKEVRLFLEQAPIREADSRLRKSLVPRVPE